ncbi:hypothetical protein KAH55_04475 [bacterium]|nr:hypothetical protein [bacterium]
MTTSKKQPQTGIGLRKERSLHAQLKQHLLRPGDQPETRVGSYIVDIVRGNTLIEVQTRNFSAIRFKLEQLLVEHPIELVYPIAVVKQLITIDAETGEELALRKSPKKGKPMDLFQELVRIPELIMHPNFRIRVVMTRVKEIRCDDGAGSWRRKGVSIHDTILEEITREIQIHTPEDLLTFLPPNLPQHFTTADLAKNGIQKRLAQKMAFCLRKCEVIEVVGKQRNLIIYQKKTPQQ